MAEKNSDEEKEAFCPYCGSKNVYGMSRVVGYFTQINQWNAGKRAEFRDRQKGNYKIPKQFAWEE